MVTGYALPHRIFIRTPTIEQRAEEVARRPSQTTFVDIGLPIPGAYDSDLLSVLVQNPFRLYALWEISHRAWKTLEKVFPASDAKRFRTVVKLHNPAWGWEAIYDAGPATRWWFEVYPDEPYQVEVGFYAPKYGYIRWLRSRQVRTPRISPGVEPALPTAGPVVAPTAPAPPVEVQEVKPQPPWWVNQLPDWLRQMLLRLFQGDALSEQDLHRLPAWLHYQLMALWSGVGPEAMRHAFMEYVPELVYQVAPETYQQVVEFQREEFRLVQAGSEVVAQPPLLHRWFPPGLGHPGSLPWGVPGSVSGLHPGRGQS
jgi:hypothetical protein